MKRKNLMVALAVAACFMGAPQRTICGSATETGEAQSQREISLTIGEQRVIDATGVASFSESTRGIVEVKIPRDARSLVVTAVRAGSTSLLLIDGKGQQESISITVFARDPSQVEKELKELLEDTPGISFSRVGSRIFIDGLVASQAQVDRIDRVVDLYAGQVSSLARMDSAAVRPRTNIRMDLTFVETRSSDGYKMGVNWPGSLGGGQSVNFTYDLMGGGAAASYQIIDQALPSLEAAAQSGWVKIAKRATLVTTNGHKATYSAGGEVNVAVSGSNAAEIRSVPYGCTLVVLPRLDPGPGILDLEVEAEVSDLSETSQDVPGRTISKVSTLVHLGLGQSIILSGLSAQSAGGSKNGLPFVSKIPLIGMLFGVQGKRREETEGLIAITPVVLDNLDRRDRRLLDEALERFEEYDGRQRVTIEDR